MRFPERFREHIFRLSAMGSTVVPGAAVGFLISRSVETEQGSSFELPNLVGLSFGAYVGAFVCATAVQYFQPEKP